METEKREVRSLRWLKNGFMGISLEEDHSSIVLQIYFSFWVEKIDFDISISQQIIF